MPPKKIQTPTLAYVAKCTKCARKHAPPLHDACLEFPVDVADTEQEGGEPDNVNLPDVQSEGTIGGTTSVGLSGTSGSNVVGDLQEGTASGGQAGTVCNDAVASQLERMAAELITLTDRYDSTRGEVAELRAELASFKMVATHVSAGSSYGIPTIGLPVQPSVPSGETTAQFTPTIAVLRRDPVIVAQADQLVAEVGASVAGNSNSNSSIKRGLVRSGGDLTPMVKTAWPQDHILGSGTLIYLSG
jgi:hypothetical protein